MSTPPNPAWVTLKAFINKGMRYYQTIDGYFYYVNPKNGCIARVKIKRNAQKVVLPQTFIRMVSSGTTVAMYGKIKGIWWELKFEKNYMVESKVSSLMYDDNWNIIRDENNEPKRKITIKMVEKHKDVIWHELDMDYIKSVYGYRCNSHQVYGGEYAVIGKRQISGDKLRSLGVANDTPKDPKWELTKSGWKNVA